MTLRCFEHPAERNEIGLPECQKQDMQSSVQKSRRSFICRDWGPAQIHAEFIGKGNDKRESVPLSKRASWLCCNKFTTSIRDYFRKKQTSSNHLRTSEEMWQVYVNLLRLHTFRLQVLSSLCQHNFQPAHPRGFALRELQPYALRKLAGELAPPIKSWTGILLYWLASASRLGNQNRFIMDLSINLPNSKIGTYVMLCHVQLPNFHRKRNHSNILKGLLFVLLFATRFASAKCLR